MTFYVSQETVSAWMTAFKPSSAISGHNPKASGSLEPKNSKTEAAVSVPGTFDVLLGRGKSNQNRPGNARYKGTTYREIHHLEGRLGPCSIDDRSSARNNSFTTFPPSHNL